MRTILIKDPVRPTPTEKREEELERAAMRAFARDHLHETFEAAMDRFVSRMGRGTPGDQARAERELEAFLRRYRIFAKGYRSALQDLFREEDGA